MTDDWSLMTDLPCLSSSSECIELLAAKAIANSPELVTLDEQIALIDERLVVAEKRIDHTSKKRWTNYISSDPLRIAANLLGGGDVQRDNIAIAFSLLPFQAIALERPSSMSDRITFKSISTKLAIASLSIIIYD